MTETKRLYYTTEDARFYLIKNGELDNGWIVLPEHSLLLFIDEIDSEGVTGGCMLTTCGKFVFAARGYLEYYCVLL